MPARRLAAVLPLLCLSFVLPGEASMVRKMDLSEMCDAAGQILRAVVVDVEKTTITAGGGQIPAIRYHLDVSEQFKGALPFAADGRRYSFTAVDIAAVETPRLAMDQEYVLFLTPPSTAGLSTMVGLGQGTFKIYGAGNVEMAVNAVDNLGLLNGIKGPVPYRTLAARIRAAL